MSAPLSEVIASPLARVQTPLSLSATEICLVAHSPSALARKRGRGGVSYKILGPGGTYSKLSGVPIGGIAEGARLSISKVLVAVSVQGVALGAHEFPLERVDVELKIRLNPDGGYAALLRYVEGAGPNFLTTVDADLAEGVKEELRRQVSTLRAVDVYRDELGSLNWNKVRLLDDAFLVEGGRVTHLAFHPKNLEVIESQINELAQQTLHAHEQAELDRQRTLEIKKQSTELELETTKAHAQLAIDSQRMALERPYEREKDVVGLLGKVIEFGAGVRGGAAADLLKDVRGDIGGLAASAVPPPLSPPVSAGHVIDAGYVDVTGHTAGFEPLTDDPLVQRVLEAGVQGEQIFAVGKGDAGLRQLLVVALRGRPPHAVRVRLRHLLDGEADEVVVLSPVTSREDLVLEFLLHYEPALENCDPDVELRYDGDQLTVVLAGSGGPLRPHIRRFIDADTRLLDALSGVLGHRHLDLVLA